MTDAVPDTSSFASPHPMPFHIGAHNVHSFRLSGPNFRAVSFFSRTGCRRLRIELADFLVELLQRSLSMPSGPRTTRQLAGSGGYCAASGGAALEPTRRLPKTNRQVEQEIRAGAFRDAAALVRAAVRHFLITREDLGSTRDQIDAMVACAVASLERGEGVDGEEFFAGLESEERQLHKQG